MSERDRNFAIALELVVRLRFGSSINNGGELRIAHVKRMAIELSVMVGHFPSDGQQVVADIFERIQADPTGLVTYRPYGITQSAIRAAV